MCDKITVIDRQHREMWSLLCRIMATKPEFLVTKDEMLVALVTVSITISSPGMAFKILCLCQACSLVKGKSQIGPFFIFLGPSLIVTRDSRNGQVRSGANTGNALSIFTRFNINFLENA